MTIAFTTPDNPSEPDWLSGKIMLGGVDATTLSDPGDEDDSDQIRLALEHTREEKLRGLGLRELKPVQVGPSMIFFQEYTYDFSGPRVKYPDHDLGDEDRSNNTFPRPHEPWQGCTRRSDYMTFSNPPRPTRGK